MGEARRRRLAGIAASLAADARADLDAFRRAQVPGRRLMSAEVMPIGDALAHPVVGPTALKAVVASYCSAHGSGDLICECQLCAVRFSPGRPPAAAMVLEISRPRHATVGLVCGPCAAVGPDGLRRMMRAAVGRDFFGGEDVQEVPPSAFAPGGSA